MKYLILAFLMNGSFASAAPVCVDIKAPELTYDAMRIEPDSSVTVFNPKYVFNGRSYWIATGKSTSQGFCVSLGKTHVRSFETHKEEWNSIVELSADGKISDSGHQPFRVLEIRCK